MSIKQLLWSLDENKKIEQTTLDNEEQLEVLIEKNIEVLNTEWMIIGRQVSVKGGFIDLLAIDRAGDIIIIELKKNKTPREVTAQSLDYASCVTEFKIEDIARIYKKYSNDSDDIGDRFLKEFGEPLDEDNVCNNINLVIVAAKMDDSTERIINYLNTFNIPINVVFFDVFKLDGKKILSRAWMIDNENTTDTIIKPKKWNGEYYVSFGVDEYRSWKDAVRYGFISAGGGQWYSNTLKMLKPDDRVWVNIPGVGYAGVGIVTAISDIAGNVKLDGDNTIFDIDSRAGYSENNYDEKTAEYIVKVKWIKTVDVNNAVKETGFFGNQNSVCRPTADKWIFTLERLKKIWNIT